MRSPSQIWSHIEKQFVRKAGCTPDATNVNSLRNLEVIETAPLKSDTSAVNPGMFIFSSVAFLLLNGQPADYIRSTLLIWPPIARLYSGIRSNTVLPSNSVVIAVNPYGDLVVKANSSTKAQLIYSLACPILSNHFVVHRTISSSR